MTKSISIQIINFYQQKISPYKGYSCAYKYYTNKHSCSEFAKKSINKFGLIKSIPLIGSHLQKCKKIYLANINKKQTTKKIDWCNETAGVCGCL